MAGERTGWRPPASLALAVAALTALVASGALVGPDSTLQPWFTAQADDGAGRRVLGVLAALGEIRIAGFVLLGTVLWACARVRSPRPAWGSAVAVVGTALTVVVLKAVTGRTAPAAGGPDVLAGGRSYPSGHAATAAVCLLLMALLLTLGPHDARRPRLVAVAVVVAGAAAWATVALGFHWVSDVVGGLLVGAAWATGVRPWLRPDTVGAAQRPGR